MPGIRILLRAVLGSAALLLAGSSARAAGPVDVTAYGDGRSLSTLQFCGGATADAVLVEPVPNGDWTGQLIRDVGIVPCTNQGGQYGLHVRLAAGARDAYFDIERVTLGNFGSRGLGLDNAANNQDGFFNGRVAGSMISNGVLGTRIGDSLTFDHVVVTGHNNVDLTGYQAPAWPQLIEMDGYVDGAFPGAVAQTQHTKILNNVFLNRGGSAEIYGTSSAVRTTVQGNVFLVGTTPFAPRIVLQGNPPTPSLKG